MVGKDPSKSKFSYAIKRSVEVISLRRLQGLCLGHFTIQTLKKLPALTSSDEFVGSAYQAAGTPPPAPNAKVPAKKAKSKARVVTKRKVSEDSVSASDVASLASADDHPATKAIQQSSFTINDDGPRLGVIASILTTSLEELPADHSVSIYMSTIMNVDSEGNEVSPPFRTSGSEYLGRKVNGIDSDTGESIIGVVVGHILETDVDDSGSPGFENETGEPAKLFHVIFDTHFTNLELHELEARLI